MEDVARSDDDLALAIQAELHSCAWSPTASPTAPIPEKARDRSWMLWSRWSGDFRKVFGARCHMNRGWESDDVADEAYPCFMHALLTWKPKPDSPRKDSVRALGLTIYYRCLIDLARREQCRQTELLTDVAAPESPSVVEENDCCVVLRAAFRDALDSLPVSVERFLAERHWLGAVPVEILAEATGLTRSQVYHAIRHVGAEFLRAFVIRHPELVELIAPGWCERNESTSDSDHH